MLSAFSAVGFTFPRIVSIALMSSLFCARSSLDNLKPNFSLSARFLSITSSFFSRFVISANAVLPSLKVPLPVLSYSLANLSLSAENPFSALITSDVKDPIPLTPDTIPVAALPNNLAGFANVLNPEFITENKDLTPPTVSCKVSLKVLSFPRI